MTRYISVWVDYRGEDGGHCAVGAGASTREEARQVALTHIKYYTDLGREILDFGAEARCICCAGTGEVAKRGRTLCARKLCPTCKGRDSIITVL